MESCTVVIFGASGDLTKRMVMPAIFRLARRGLLSPEFRLIGFSRTKLTDDAFRTLMRAAVLREPKDGDESAWNDFASRLSYVTAPYDDEQLEKPFGRDLATARALNADIALRFDDTDIYRIDHFLGKEIIQNIFLRFANNIFEPVWNRNYVDHVQITAAETLGMDGRGAYYETSARVPRRHRHTSICCSTRSEEIPPSSRAPTKWRPRGTSLTPW